MRTAAYRLCFGAYKMANISATVGPASSRNNIVRGFKTRSPLDSVAHLRIPRTFATMVDDMASTSEPWSRRAADKRARLAKTIPPEWRVDGLADDEVSAMDAPAKYMTPADLEITCMSATALVAAMADGRLSAVEVTTAFCHRAAIAMQLVNCALEFFPDLALKRAAELDAYRAKAGHVMGPLHGLPVSLKDQFRIEGLETSMGFVAWLDTYETAASESILTRVLRDAGAVFYIKTSVVQTLMACDPCENFIIGRTTNPRNKHWSSGGSSGGEGALLGMRGSVLGFGTDYGGSIRVPAAFNRLFGLRPCLGRLPYARLANVYQGHDAVGSVVGPMGHDVPDLRLAVKSILAAEPWKYDTKVVPLPWRVDHEDAIRAKAKSGGLTIGYFFGDFQVSAQPPIRRAIQMVVDALTKHGHVATPIPSPVTAELQATQPPLYRADGGKNCLDTIAQSGEPLLPPLATAFAAFPAVTFKEAYAASDERHRLHMLYLEHIRQMEARLGRELDAIIAPTCPSAGVLPGRWRTYNFTSWVNMFDWTSLAMPVTLADGELDRKADDYQPLSDRDRLVWEDYDADAFHGAPAGVQIIGRRLCEEKILALGEEIDRLLKLEAGTAA